MKCNECNTEMIQLCYTSDDDYGMRTSRVHAYLENEHEVVQETFIGNLVYCPNCGNVRVKLKNKEEGHE